MQINMNDVTEGLESLRNPGQVEINGRHGLSRDFNIWGFSVKRLVSYSEMDFNGSAPLRPWHPRQAEGTWLGKPLPGRCPLHEKRQGAFARLPFPCKASGPEPIPSPAPSPDALQGKIIAEHPRYSRTEHPHYMVGLDLFKLYSSTVLISGLFVFATIAAIK